MLSRSRLYLLLLLIVSGGVYCLGLSGPLLFDDGVNLAPLHSLKSHLVPSYAVLLTNPSSSMGRPVSMLSFLLNFWLFGFSVVAFKATNIFLHLGIGAAVYAFVNRLLSQTKYCESRHRVALVVTACWLLSPLYVSTVLYVVQRMAMLSTLFTLLALSEYLVFRESLSNGGIRWRRLLLFCLYSLLGILSKENAALIPLFLLVLELFFCAPISHEKGKQIWAYVVTALIGLPIVAFAGLFYLKSATFFSYGSRPFDLSERLLTEARVVWSYVGSLLVPRSNEFGLFHDDIPISKNWISPATTVIALIGWLVVVIGAAYARKNDTWRPIAGGVAFFLVGHLLESTAFPLEIYFEHRNYLPGIGIYLVLALASELAIKKKRLSLGAAKFALGAYLFVFLAALSQRTLIWSSYENIVYSSYQSHPNSPRALVEAASQDAQFGRTDDALEKLTRARESSLAPPLGVNIQIIWTYCLANRPGLDDKVKQLFGDVSLDGSPYTSIAMRQFNELLMKQRCDKVPYAQALVTLAKRIGRYYQLNEYKGSEVAQVGNIDTLQTRVLEGLNLTGQTAEVIDLVTQINHAGFGGINSDLLESIALIDVGRFDQAKLLIDKLKATNGMAVRMEAEHIATVEAMYWARLKREKIHDDG